MRKSIILLVFVLFACESPDLTSLSNNNNGENIQLTKRTKFVTISKWFIEQYTPYTNKRVGLWWPLGPDKDYSWYKDMGFSLIFSKYSFAPDWGHYSTIKNIYDPQNIMYGINKDYSTEVSEFLTAHGEDCSEVATYYIDEPLENYARGYTHNNTYSKSELITLANTLYSTDASKTIIIGSSDLGELSAPPIGIGYPHGSVPAINPYDYKDVLETTNNVKMICDMYQYGGLDYWQDFINFYGKSNVIGIFINADDAVFYSQNTSSNDLFLVRREIDELWLYAASIGTGQEGIDRLKDFSYKAWETSWLNERQEKEYRYTYVWVIDDNPPLIFDENNSGWVLVEINQTSNTRIANRSWYNYICPDNYENSPDQFDSFPVYFQID